MRLTVVLTTTGRPTSVNALNILTELSDDDELLFITDGERPEAAQMLAGAGLSCRVVTHIHEPAVGDFGYSLRNGYGREAAGNFVVTGGQGMASLSRALTRIKQDGHTHLPNHLIVASCLADGHRWRERMLGPVATLHLFVMQMLHCTTAIRGLRHLAKTPLIAGACYAARKRLPLALPRSLLRSSAQALIRWANA